VTDEEILREARLAQVFLHTAPNQVRVYHYLVLELLKKARMEIPNKTEKQRELRDAIEWVTRL